jgi:hypothetical protein
LQQRKLELNLPKSSQSPGQSFPYSVSRLRKTGHGVYEIIEIFYILKIISRLCYLLPDFYALAVEGENPSTEIIIHKKKRKLSGDN